MFDLLITGGRVIDGTGQTWFRADVGVTGDTMTVIRGDASGLEAGRTIDASGCVVCPGFIDMHSHSDLSLLSDPKHEAKLAQGVTTDALGQDGLSYAPSSPEKLEQLLWYLAAVNGTPPPDIRWGSVKEFLDLFDERAACNVVYFVPHAAVRVEAMGWDQRLPTEDELAHMQSLVEQGIKDGAFGFSTGLTYVPGTYSDTHELVEVCKSLRDSGGMYVTHCRYFRGDGLLDPFREAIDMRRGRGLRPDFPLPQPSRRYGRADERPDR